MRTTILEPSFLVAGLQQKCFKHRRQLECEAALLRLALLKPVFDASQVDETVAEHSPNALGAACGALIAVGLIEATGERVKSSRENAKGRRVNQLRLCEGKRQTILTWFACNCMSVEVPAQQLGLEIAL